MNLRNAAALSPNIYNAEQLAFPSDFGLAFGVTTISTAHWNA